MSDISRIITTEGVEYGIKDSVTRAEIARLIDSGAKNLFYTEDTTSTITQVTFTASDDNSRWTVNGRGKNSSNQDVRTQKQLNFTVSSYWGDGDYVLSGCPAGGTSGGAIRYCLYIWDQTAGGRVIPNSLNDTGDGREFYWAPNSSHQYNITIDIRAGYTASNLVFQPMICTKEAWELSKKFVKYCPSQAELYAMIKRHYKDYPPDPIY